MPVRRQTKAVVPIITGEVRFRGAKLGDLLKQSKRKSQEGPYGAIASNHGVTLPGFKDTAPDNKALPARMRKGKWIVDCPDCKGAEFAFEGTKLMMCMNCFNATVGGSWRKVLWPSDRDKIEAEMVKRPVPHTRNWEPGESLAKLQSENLTRGLK